MAKLLHVLISTVSVIQPLCMPLPVLAIVTVFCSSSPDISHISAISFGFNLHFSNVEYLVYVLLCCSCMFPLLKYLYVSFACFLTFFKNNTVEFGGLYIFLCSLYPLRVAWQTSPVLLPRILRGRVEPGGKHSRYTKSQMLLMTK